MLRPIIIWRSGFIHLTAIAKSSAASKTFCRTRISRMAKNGSIEFTKRWRNWKIRRTRTLVSPIAPRGFSLIGRFFAKSPAPRPLSCTPLSLTLAPPAGWPAEEDTHVEYSPHPDDFMLRIGAHAVRGERRDRVRLCHEQRRRRHRRHQPFDQQSGADLPHHRRPRGQFLAGRIAGLCQQRGDQHARRLRTEDRQADEEDHALEPSEQYRGYEGRQNRGWHRPRHWRARHHRSGEAGSRKDHPDAWPPP